MTVEQFAGIDRRRVEVVLRATAAARELTTAVLAAQAVGIAITVEVEWVLRDQELVQDVVAYLAPGDGRAVVESNILAFRPTGA